MLIQLILFENVSLSNINNDIKDIFKNFIIWFTANVQADKRRKKRKYFSYNLLSSFWGSFDHPKIRVIFKILLSHTSTLNPYFSLYIFLIILLVPQWQQIRINKYKLESGSHSIRTRNVYSRTIFYLWYITQLLIYSDTYSRLHFKNIRYTKRLNKLYSYQSVNTWHI